MCTRGKRRNYARMMNERGAPTPRGVLKLQCNFAIALRISGCKTLDDRIDTESKLME